MAKVVINLHTIKQFFLVHVQQVHENVSPSWFINHLHQEIDFQECPGLLGSPMTTMACSNCKAVSSYLKASSTSFWPDGLQQMPTTTLLMLFCPLISLLSANRLSTHSKARHCARPPLLCMRCPCSPACIHPPIHGSTLLCELSHHVFVTLRSSASAHRLAVSPACFHAL